MKIQIKILSIVICTLFLTQTQVFAAAKSKPTTREFKMITVDVNGSKIWLPSNIVVNKGDKVKIHAKSQVPGNNSVHGLSIDIFNVKEVATKQGVKIEFTANQAGIYPIWCHLHPTHIGSQLIVLD